MSEDVFTDMLEDDEFLDKKAKTPDDILHLRISRLIRRAEKRDKRIAGLERKIQLLEKALAWRTTDLETLSKNLHRTVQDALCNVRMIPVFGGKREQVITEIRNTTP